MLFAVDERDPQPIYLQLSMAVKDAVRTGELLPGDALPSVRDLARDLGVNLHTVHRAYRTLRDDGVVRLGLGRRARVAAQRTQKAGREEVLGRLSGALEQLVTEGFHLGLTTGDLKRLVEEFATTHARARRSP
jgi:GntR family transcriptional regulator